VIYQAHQFSQWYATHCRRVLCLFLCLHHHFSSYIKKHSFSVSQVAIIGRPNVGKSALFNRLIKRRTAIVHDTPLGHVTRDYQEAEARLGDLKFTVVDTSGMEPFPAAGSIQSRSLSLTARVIERAHVTLLLVDGKSGILPADSDLARWLRQNVNQDTASKIVVVVNKCERRGNKSEMYSSTTSAVHEAPRLGFGEAVAISAETGEGMVDLYTALQPHIDAVYKDLNEQSNPSEHARDQNAKPVKVAIMGVTNVGKSTLMNRILREERCMTGPERGLTRDSIGVRFDYEEKGQANPVTVEITDTAGWVKRASRLVAHDDVGGAVASIALAESHTVLQFVHVVVLVVDAVNVLDGTKGLTHSEAALAAKVVTEGRALVVLANKIDALGKDKDKETVELLVRKSLSEVVPEIGECPIIAMSALTGSGAETLLPTILRVYRLWNLRLPTARLNRWLRDLSGSVALFGKGTAAVGGIKYLVQIKSRPPSFVAFLSRKREKNFQEASRRFLRRRIQHEFGLAQVPLRLEIKSTGR
jgi:GTP-binding protein